MLSDVRLRVREEGRERVDNAREEHVGKRDIVGRQPCLSDLDVRYVIGREQKRGEEARGRKGG